MNWRDLEEGDAYTWDDGDARGPVAFVVGKRLGRWNGKPVVELLVVWDAFAYHRLEWAIAPADEMLGVRVFKLNGPE